LDSRIYSRLFEKLHYANKPGIDRPPGYKLCARQHPIKGENRQAIRLVVIEG